MKETLISILNILGFLSGSFVLSMVINAFFLKFARSLGIRNKNHLDIRWSSVSKPSLGGISFYISFLIGFIFYAIIFGESDVFQNKALLGFFFSVTLAFFMGLSDDAYDTRPLIKLTVQIACGVILVLTGNGIELFSIDWLDITLTILWVVGMMNSINMLDNMDGITSLTSVFIILTILGISIPFSMTDNVYLFLMITILGCLGGFLFFNWNPSKMFMGDTGSQFLGVFLAFLGIKFLWNANLHLGEVVIFKNLTLTMVTFIVPLTDTIFVTINRIRKGQSPMIGGKDHTTHTLSYQGLSDRQIGYVFLFMALASALMAQMMAKYLPPESLMLTLFWLYFIVKLVFFFRLKKTLQEKDNSEAKKELND